MVIQAAWLALFMLFLGIATHQLYLMSRMSVKLGYRVTFKKYRQLRPWKFPLQVAGSIAAFFIVAEMIELPFFQEWLVRSFGGSFHMNLGISFACGYFGNHLLDAIGSKVAKKVGLDMASEDE